MCYTVPVGMLAAVNRPSDPVAEQSLNPLITFMMVKLHSSHEDSGIRSISDSIYLLKSRTLLSWSLFVGTLMLEIRFLACCNICNIHTANHANRKRNEEEERNKEMIQ